MRTYTTSQGDMWDGIAYEQLGDVSYTDALMNLNQAYREYYTLPAGLVLVLPEPVTPPPSSLPPWKR